MSSPPLTQPIANEDDEYPTGPLPFDLAESSVVSSSGPPLSGGAGTGADDDDLTPSLNPRDNVIVSVRMRPFNRLELNTNQEPAFDTHGNTIQQIIPSSANSSHHGVSGNPGTGTGTGTSNSTGPSSGPGMLSFAYDNIFDEEHTNADIFDAVGESVVSSTVVGFSGIILAYGQTSSGKTWTIRGSPQDEGLIGRCVRRLFEKVQEFHDRQFVLRVSYLECYNEVINDLLDPRNANLKIREDQTRGVFVENLKEEIVVSAEQTMALLQIGEAHRHVGRTNYNDVSSRSHTIFRVIVESQARDENLLDTSDEKQAHPQKRGSGRGAVRVSTLNLVDLAGSENAVKAGASQRVRETGYINKSLLALGTVIWKITENSTTHVPYRDSKLTRILESSLNGRSRIAMICTVSPASSNIEESLSTLKFAQRAKRIRANAKLNEKVDSKTLLRQYRDEIERLKRELELVKRTSIAPSHSPSSAAATGGASTAAGAGAASGIGGLGLGVPHALGFPINVSASGSATPAYDDGALSGGSNYSMASPSSSSSSSTNALNLATPIYKSTLNRRGSTTTASALMDSRRQQEAIAIQNQIGQLTRLIINYDEAAASDELGIDPSLLVAPPKRGSRRRGSAAVTSSAEAASVTNATAAAAAAAAARSTDDSDEIKSGAASSSARASATAASTRLTVTTTAASSSGSADAAGVGGKTPLAGDLDASGLPLTTSSAHPPAGATSLPLSSRHLNPLSLSLGTGSSDYPLTLPRAPATTRARAASRATPNTDGSTGFPFSPSAAFPASGTPETGAAVYGLDGQDALGLLTVPPLAAVTGGGGSAATASTSTEAVITTSASTAEQQQASANVAKPADADLASADAPTTVASAAAAAAAVVDSEKEALRAQVADLHHRLSQVVSLVHSKNSYITFLQREAQIMAEQSREDRAALDAWDRYYAAAQYKNNTIIKKLRELAEKSAMALGGVANGGGGDGSGWQLVLKRKGSVVDGGFDSSSSLDNMGMGGVGAGGGAGGSEGRTTRAHSIDGTDSDSESLNVRVVGGGESHGSARHGVAIETEQKTVSVMSSQTSSLADETAATRAGLNATGAGVTSGSANSSSAASLDEHDVGLDLDELFSTFGMDSENPFAEPLVAYDTQ